MAETRKLIKASGELQEEIAAKLKVTTRSVRSALAYDPKGLFLRRNEYKKKGNSSYWISCLSFLSG